MCDSGGWKSCCGEVEVGKFSEFAVVDEHPIGGGEFFKVKMKVAVSGMKPWWMSRRRWEEFVHRRTTVHVSYLSFLKTDPAA